MERYEYREAVEAFREVHGRPPAGSPARSTWPSRCSTTAASRPRQAEEGRGVAHREQLRRGPAAARRRPRARSEEPPRPFLPGHHPRTAGEIWPRRIALQEGRPRSTPTTPPPGTGSREHPDRSGTTRTSPPDARQAKEQIALYTKALERNPYLSQRCTSSPLPTGWRGDPKKPDNELTRLLCENSTPIAEPPPAPATRRKSVYGEMGKYATVIDPFPERQTPANGRAAAQVRACPADRGPARPRVTGGSSRADFTGRSRVIGRARARFGAAVATFDADGDGRLDLYLASAVVGPKGLRRCSLLNKGDGRFEDVSAAFGLARGPREPRRRRGRLRRRPPDRPVPDRRRRQPAAPQPRARRFEDVTSRRSRRSAPRRSRSRPAGSTSTRTATSTSTSSTTAAAEPPIRPSWATRPAAGPRELGVSQRRQAGRIPAAARPHWAPLAVGRRRPRRHPGALDRLVALDRGRGPPGWRAPHTGVAALDIDDDRDLDLVFSADGAPPCGAQRPARATFRASRA